MLLLAQMPDVSGAAVDSAAAALVLLPEIALVVGIVSILVARTISERFNSWAVSIGLVAGAFAAGLLMVEYIDVAANPGRRDVLQPFLLIHTPLTVFFRLLVVISLALTLGLCLLTGLPRPRQAVDFTVLVLGASIGMMVTSSAAHVLTVFLGIEMMSVPSYVLAGFFKGRRTATEASLKYVVYGAGAAGLMLYGLSLLFGLAGGGSFDTLAPAITSMFSANEMITTRGLTGLFAILLVFAGVSYKLAAVPFHFWCPDAFTGAPAEVGGFLSVASKVATLGLMMRFTLLLVDTDAVTSLGCLTGVIAAISVTYGNLAAYRQNDAKRLLAYSTIAHAGYMLMGVAALLVAPPEIRVDVQAAVLYYAFVYVFMNLTAFGCVAMLREAAGGTDIRRYAGLGRRRLNGAVIGIAMTLAAISLIGLPPTAGFFGKLLVFGSLFRASTGSPLLVGVFVVGAINTVFSLFYYLRMVRPLFVEQADESVPREVVTSQQAAFAGLLSAPLVLMFIPLGGLILEFCELVVGGR